MKQLMRICLMSFAGVASCVAFALAGYNTGTIVQVHGDSALYYMINGYAAHIPSPAVYTCLGLASHPRATISRDQLNAMGKASFLIEGGDGKIYRVDGDRKRWVPNMSVFNRLGFNSSQVIHISAEQVKCIPEVTPLH